MTHPTVSSMMAEAISAIPTFRRMKPISRTTIATIFTEAIDNAVPRNSEVMVCATERARCCPKRSRRGDPLVGFRQHCGGQQLAEREPAGEGHYDPRGRGADGGTPRLSNQPEVGLHPGQQQQHQDAKLRDGIDHGLLLLTPGEDRALRLGPDRAEYGRPEENSGDQLPHHGRLPDPLHRLAHQTDAPGLSASTIARLKEVWRDEHEHWRKRNLSAKHYV